MTRPGVKNSCRPAFKARRKSRSVTSRLDRWDSTLNRVEEGVVTVLDVRPPLEFEAGHLPTAINLTVAEIKQRFADLDSNQEIVAYCRGPHCILSFEAVAFLRAKGFNVRRLEDGFPEWREAGFPVHSA